MTKIPCGHAEPRNLTMASRADSVIYVSAFDNGQAYQADIEYGSPSL